MTSYASGSRESDSFDWRRNQLAVTVATFIGFAGFTLVMPFLPLYFEQLGLHDRSAITIWSGLSLGITPAITAAMSPVWARVAERFGHKLMVARSLFSFVVIMALMGGVWHPWHVFALRGLQGFFAGYGSIALTMAAESAPREEMAAAIGWVQTAQRLGPALGPIIGGTLAQTVGLRESFVVAAGFYLVALMLIVWGYRETPRPRQPAEPATHRPTFRSLRQVPNFALFMGAVFGLQLVDRSFGPVLPLFLRDIEIAESRVPFLSGLIFTATAGAAAVGNQVCGRLLIRWPAGRLVPVAAGFAGVGVALLGAGPPLGLLLLTAVAFGFGIGVATTAIYTTAGHRVAPASRGLAFGYLTTAYLVGLAVSPVIAGLIGAYSMRAIFFIDAAGLVALAWTIKRTMVT